MIVKQFSGVYVFRLKRRQMMILRTMKRDYVLSKMLLAHADIKGITFKDNEIADHLEREDATAERLVKWIHLKIKEALI